MTETYFRNFGSIYYFFAKNCFFILLPLDKILFVLLFTFVSTYVFNTESRIFSENLG